MKKIRCRLGCIAAVALCSFLSSASAELTQYEGFDYTPGEDALNSQTGGTGFAGPWGTQGADIVSGSFSYTDAGGNQLVTSGNRAFMDATDPSTANPTPPGAAVSPIRNIGGVVGDTVYISFLAEQTAGTTRDVSVSLFAAGSGAVGTAERISIGHGNGFTTWGAYALADGAKGAHSTAPANDLSLLVARIDANANGANERVRLYVNPTLGTEPAGPNVDFSDYNFIDSISDFTRLRMRAGGSNGTSEASWLEVDEIRIGTTYADVTPVPEPATSLLGLMGGALLAARRRRR